MNLEIGLGDQWFLIDYHWRRMIECDEKEQRRDSFMHSVFLSGYLLGLYYLVDPAYQDDIETLIDVLTETNGIIFIDFQRQ
jgi:hypothetical protein